MTDDSKALEAAARAMGRAVFGNLAAYEQRQDMFQRWAATAALGNTARQITAQGCAATGTASCNPCRNRAPAFLRG